MYINKQAGKKIVSLMLNRNDRITYKPSEQQLNTVVEIVLVMVMVMDRKMLLVDKQPLVYQFSDQLQLNVFVVVVVVVGRRQLLVVAEIVVEQIDVLE